MYLILHRRTVTWPFYMRFVLVPFVTIIFMLGFTFPIKNSRQL
ncbi:hypothetical protein HMPREF0291_11730 [Corynebacterium genitalium ATCC 33030]|uniref:Uncharacterized protein n=1 Tax=Corynebacterium genitalium ATCC 33030 TaxID=585529 RepID=D7WD42_9CORY|nr:hypothetical protein HMPREF0291_11730 [Corynebacterium genitalium ATCC 33030]